MIRVVGVIFLAGAVLLVVYAEGLHWIALWNLSPLALAGLAIFRSPGIGRLSWSAVVFAAVVTLVIVLIHAAWLFDWGGTRTESSTAGLIFLFSPICAVLLGAVGLAGVKIAGRAGKGNTARQASSAVAQKRSGSSTQK
ncbi:MAG: hypothetical protein HY788_10980 [Deltaproteobacteria bacterium]|nr:hypothetical protein [Deltaproteobacteria bacterium]